MFAACSVLIKVAAGQLPKTDTMFPSPKGSVGLVLSPSQPRRAKPARLIQYRLVSGGAGPFALAHSILRNVESDGCGPRT